MTNDVRDQFAEGLARAAGHQWKFLSLAAQQTFQMHADSLLPVVNAIVADQIERLADERTWVTEHDNEVVSVRDLYEHVARLRGELEPVVYDFPPESE